MAVRRPFGALWGSVAGAHRGGRGGMAGAAWSTRARLRSLTAIDATEKSSILGVAGKVSMVGIDFQSPKKTFPAASKLSAEG